LQLPYDDAKRDRLVQAYLHLGTFPEVKETLHKLPGIKLAVLSNGAPAMLQDVVSNSGLAALIPEVLSVDELKIYKPTPKVYQLAVDRLGVPARAIGFVSSNCWDAAGAKSFGFRTFWVNRAGAPLDGLGFAPDHELRSLAELPALIG
jgi:2-haloacid dehalogenase